MITGLRAPLRLAAWLCLLSAAPVASGRPQAPPSPAPQQQPVFRAGVTLVPVDVRVLDRDGKPIKDLTAADFTVLEDGVPQTILQFVSHGLTPETLAEDARPPVRDFGSTTTLAPQNQRVFLIVLGRGRLQEPAMGLDALIRFVRLRLMPQDHVAVLAWNRATDFTTNRDEVVNVLTRFRDSHNEIEMLLRQYYSGLTALYGPRNIPENIQIRIDRVFRDANARTMPTLAGTDAARVASDTRRTAELIQRQQILDAGGMINLSPIEAELSTVTGMTFDQFVETSRQTLQDVGNIYTGIEYLRQIEGEKHLVFLTEQGFLLPRADDDRSVAAVAADARVAIDTIQTGGVAGELVNASSALVTSRGFALGALRTVAERTGGQVSVSDYAENALTRVLTATEFGYQLGYSPTNTTWNGRSRRIEVRVNRPGARVHYRRSYFARLDKPFERRKYLAYSRILGALGWSEDIRDLRVTATARDERDPSGARFVAVEATIDPERLRVSWLDGQRVVRLDVAVFCGSRNNELLGESWQQINLTLTEDLYRRLQKSGVTFSMRVPVKTTPAYTKVVVYDYDADLLGSVLKRMR